MCLQLRADVLSCLNVDVIMTSCNSLMLLELEASLVAYWHLDVIMTLSIL